MSASYKLLQRASHQLDDIFLYSLSKWGSVQAEAYIKGLFERFEDIAAQQAVSRPISAEFGVSGYFCIYKHHYIYWRYLPDNLVGIVTVLHERMHQTARIQKGFL